METFIFMTRGVSINATLGSFFAMYAFHDSSNLFWVTVSECIFEKSLALDRRVSLARVKPVKSLTLVTDTHTFPCGYRVCDCRFYLDSQLLSSI